MEISDSLVEEIRKQAAKVDGYVTISIHFVPGFDTADIEINERVRVPQAAKPKAGDVVREKKVLIIRRTAT